MNCHQLYQHPLLTEPIRLVDGKAAVPNKPGLGYEIDWDVVQRYRVEKPKQRPDPRRMIESVLRDGRRVYYGNTGQVNFVLNPARVGTTPYYTHGVKTHLLPDDGSARWRELYNKASKEPLIVRG